MAERGKCPMGCGNSSVGMLCDACAARERRITQSEDFREAVRRAFRWPEADDDDDAPVTGRGGGG